MRIGTDCLCRREHEYLLKFLLVGDSDVGKDEIVAELLGPSVSSVPDTLFISLTAPKTTTILLEGRPVKLHLWDASGQGRFSTIIKSCSRGVQGILIVYDITNRWSFDGIKRWLAEIDEVSTLAFFNVRESITELARLVIARNGLHCLWRNCYVPSLQDLCCRVIVKNVPNVHAIGRLPLPNSVKFKVRSFVAGAELCMRNMSRRDKMRKGITLAPKCFSQIVRPLYPRIHHQRANCCIM